MFGYLLDVHAAFGAGHDHVAVLGTIQQNRQVKFLWFVGAGIVHVFGDEYLIDLFALGARLMRHQHFAQKIFGNRPHVLNRLGQSHTALFAALHLSLAATTGVNLRLDHVPLGTRLLAEVAGHFHGLVGRIGHDAFLNADAEFFKNALALVFVNIHLEFMSL